MTAIKNLEKRLAALEPTSPGEDFSWLSKLTSAELRNLDEICMRLATRPDGEVVLNDAEREIIEAITKRLELD